MLGFTQVDDSIYVFLEGQDLQKLGKETITGTYFDRNNFDKKGLLQLSKRKIIDTIENIVNQPDNNISLVDTIKDDMDSIIRMNIEIRSRAYLDLIDTGYAESNNENTRICIYNANKTLYCVNPFDQVTYDLLKQYEMQLSNKKS